MNADANANVIAFRAPKTAPTLRARAASVAKIVTLETWRSEPRARRTPNGVFFTTSVLTTTGDFA